MVAYLAKNPDGLQKVRQQFEQSVGNLCKRDPLFCSLDKKELLRKALTLETVQDQEFLNMVMQEALRFQPPAPGITPIVLD